MPYSRLDKMGDSASPLGYGLFWSDSNYISRIRPLFRSSNPLTIFTLNRCSKAYYFNEKCNTLKTKSTVQGMGCGVVNPKQPNAMFPLVRHKLPSCIPRVDYIVFTLIFLSILSQTCLLCLLCYFCFLPSQGGETFKIF